MYVPLLRSVCTFAAQCMLLLLFECEYKAIQASLGLSLAWDWQFIFQYYLHTLHYILTFLERPHLRTLAEQLAIFFYPVHPLYP